MSRGFQSATMKSIDALRSPVFDFLKHMQLPFFPMADILLRWVQLRSTKNVKHLEREGVCQWVYENIDHLVEHVPKGYPRERKILQHKDLTIADIFMTLLTMIVVVAFGLLVFMWRDKHDIKYAQVYALLMTALGTSTQIFFEPFDQAIYLINIFWSGYLFLSLVWLFMTYDASNISCVFNQWLWVDACFHLLSFNIVQI